MKDGENKAYATGTKNRNPCCFSHWFLLIKHFCGQVQHQAVLMRGLSTLGMVKKRN